MTKLDGYIGRAVFWAILAVLAVIVSLGLLFAFIDELGDLSLNYSVADALWYVFWTTPRRVYDMLPMAALIGCLVGLGTLASHSELTIIRAAGVSVGRIVWAVMKPMLVLLVAGMLLGEYLAPWTENLAQGSRAVAQGGGEAQSAKRGLWHRQGNEYVHINAVQPNGTLLGVTRYQFDEQRNLKRASFARTARFENGQWQLQQIQGTLFFPQEKRTEIQKLDTEQWPIELTAQTLNAAVLEPDVLSIQDLWSYAHYLQSQALNNARYWLAFWSKILQPLVTASLVLLAISFIFGPLRSVTLGQRLFTGVLVGFIFRIAQELLGPSSLVFGFSPLWAVLLPAGLCAVVGVYLLRRAG